MAVSWVSQLLSVAAKPLQWWVVVAPWEQGLRIRLGKGAKVLYPGAHFRIPFVDRVYLQSLRLRVISDAGQTVATADGKVLTVTAVISYEVRNLAVLYGALANPEHMLLMLVSGRIAGVISRTSSALVSIASIEQESQPTPEECEAWGIGSVTVKVTSFAFVRTYRLLMNDYRNLSGLDVDAWHGKVAGS